MEQSYKIGIAYGLRTLHVLAGYEQIEIPIDRGRLTLPHDSRRVELLHNRRSYDHVSRKETGTVVDAGRLPFVPEVHVPLPDERA